MIGEQTVARIETMLAAGELSQRQIARETGVSRGTVLAIGKGRHVRQVACGKSHVARKETAAYQCAGCQYWVRITPCVICAARRMRSSSIARQQLDRRP